MIGSKRISSNAFWNLMGQVAPTIVAFFSIPPLIRTLGVEKFGVIALAWMVLGYFSLFDLGIGRALTQIVSSRGGTPREAKLSELIGTAYSVLLMFGIIGGLFLILLSPVIVDRLLHVSSEIRRETIWSFALMGIAVPVVTITSAQRGIIEARQSFVMLNVIRIPIGIYSFLAPWVMTFYTTKLDSILLVLVFGRLFGLIAHEWLVRRCFPGLRLKWTPEREALSDLLHLGGWISVSGIISPLMVNLDRLVIGTIISLSAVAYYATPYELVSKLMIIGSAFAGVFYPVVAAAKSLEDFNNVRENYFHIMKTIGWIMIPIVSMVIIGAEWGLGKWLSPAFALESGPVMRILALGVLINAFATVSYAMVQGLGRPDWTGKLHLIELPIYIVLLWLLIRFDGIRGAALAWTLRVIIDTFCLIWVSEHIFRNVRRVASDL